MRAGDGGVGDRGKEGRSDERLAAQQWDRDLVLSKSWELGRRIPYVCLFRSEKMTFGWLQLYRILI